MKRCFPGLILLFLISCEVENSTPSGADPVSGESERQDLRILEEQLEATILPKVEFMDTPLFDAIATLQSLSGVHSQDGVGVSFLIEGWPRHEAEPLITLTLGKVSLAEAVNETAELAGMKARFEAGRVVLVPKSAPDPVFLTKVFPIPPFFLEMLEGSQPNGSFSVGESDDGIHSPTEAAKAAFERAGISFARNSSIALDPSAMELRVFNLENEVNRIREYFDALQSMAEELNDTTVKKIEERLRTITVPHVDFTEIPFQEALQLLQRYSAEFAPDGRGLKFVVELESANGLSNLSGETGSTMERPVSLKRKNVTLSEALSATAAQVSAKYVVESYAIKFVSNSTPDRVFITRAFAVPLSLFDISTQEQPDPFADPTSPPAAETPAPLVAKKALENAGIYFPGEANAIYEPTSGHLIVRNTEGQMELIEAFIESLRKEAKGTN